VTVQTKPTVWVFSGPNARFPGAVFSSGEKAETWIAQHRLSGLLTEYPLDSGAYDWAIQFGVFTPKRPEHTSSAFIGSFTSAHMAHAHFEDGKVVAE
jgi:hypothetical protein